ncbi:hypothetical protein [Paenibacillus dakarensis]|uniref:hypothetical protein n=1 Tax=Paenibacillus dakarensis TaxID=1527293 RepID=UPI0006D57073|nr:hypothetical protein [Paenibacillus dakarensis]
MKKILTLQESRPITLQQRLSMFKGHLVEINAPNTGLEPGRLEMVSRSNFIKVNGELFIPSSLNSIRVFDTKPPRQTLLIGVRTVFPSGKAFSRIRLVRIGTDFIELLGKEKHPSRILFPLNKVEGIYRAK